MKKTKKNKKKPLLSRKTMTQVTKFGNQIKLARMLGISQAYVSKMKKTGKLTAYLYLNGHSKKVERMAAAR